MNNEWILDWDGYWKNPNANPNCQTCHGYGVVDTGCNYGCILDNCPTCCGPGSSLDDGG
jgi:hypothetical protein